jgi:hypothetical protein
MKGLRKVLMASLSVAILATSAAEAAPRTDYSDQWWVAAEPGWGASVQQQGSILFVDLMIYGADGKATWLTASAFQQSGVDHDVFTGDLYATTGPAPASSFNTSALSYRKVGTLRFDAAATDDATIAYTIDGAATSRKVTRQTWGRHSLDGTWYAVWDNGCSWAAAFDWWPTQMVIRHGADNQISLDLTCPWCWTPYHQTLTGQYAQSGHLGRVAATAVAPATGSLAIADIERTAAGFTATLHGQLFSGGMSCEVSNGRIAAVPAASTVAASGTNYADQWWVSSEPGWGVSVQQQSDILFFDVLAYGTDGKAAWLTATATPQAAAAGHDLFSGDLYRTTGPLVSGSFDPTKVDAQRVGVMTFDATGPSQATLSYIVDGATNARGMTRQTWLRESLAGNYAAVWAFGCNDPMGDWGFTEVVVQHGADDSIAMTVTTWVSWFDVKVRIAGAYSQAGRLGEIRGSIVDENNKPTGPITITEIEKTATGFTGRIPLGTYAPCGKEGRVAAYREF